MRLLGATLRLAEVERRAVEVSSSLLWIQSRGSTTYLGNQEISIALYTAFGRDTVQDHWTVNFVLEKGVSNLATSPLSPVTPPCCSSTSDSKEMCCSVVFSPSLSALLQFATTEVISVNNFDIPTKIDKHSQVI